MGIVHSLDPKARILTKIAQTLVEANGPNVPKPFVCANMEMDRWTFDVLAKRAAKWPFKIRKGSLEWSPGPNGKMSYDAFLGQFKT